MADRRDLLLGEVRRLAEGARTEIGPFRDLLRLLLEATVLDPRQPAPGVYYARGTRDRAEIGGVGRHQFLTPLPLRDGRWLKLAISLHVEDTEHGRRLKASQSTFQYQAAAEPDTPDWIFRYDYLRDPRGSYPPAHLQINADLLVGGVLPEIRPLGRIHFPTDRVPLEGVIRLLAEDFAVPCAQPPEVWRPVLAEAEKIFKEIAHRPAFGPAA